jgi:hypothetical protein
MSDKLFSEQLRQAILKSGLTRYRISMETGIKLNQLSRFINAKSGLSIKNIDKLLCCIGGKLAPSPPRPQPKAAAPKVAAKVKAAAKKKSAASRAATKGKSAKR